MSDNAENIEIANGTPPTPEMGQVLITYDPKTGTFTHKFWGNLDLQRLVNHLEVIKAQLVNSQLHSMMQAMAKQQARGIVGPDGRPPRM